MDTTPLTHISEQTEVASTRVDYAKFHSQLQIPLDSFSTYATELLNWSERDVKVTFEEVLKGMEIIAELIDKEEDKAAWKETIQKSENLLRWFDYDLYQISFSVTDHEVDPEKVPFYHLFSISKIHLHVSDDHGVIAIPNCFSKTLRSLSLPDIASQLEALNPGHQISRDAIILMWYTLIHSLFRFENRSTKQKYFLAGLAGQHYPAVSIRSIRARNINAFFLPPVDGASFENALFFIMRFLYINSLSALSRQKLKSAWALSAFHYGNSPDIQTATAVAEAVFMTRRMSLYLTGVAYRKMARLSHEGEAATCLEDLCFYVDDNFFRVPVATFSRCETMSVFVEWATHFCEDNMAFQPTKQTTIDAFRKYVNASDGFKDEELAKEEVATFWKERVDICAPTTSNSGEPQPQPQSNQGQVQSLSDQLAALTRQKADADGLNADLTSQLADANGQLADGLNADLTSQLADAHGQLANATAQLSDLTTQNVALNEQVTSLQAQTAQLSDLTNQNAALNDQVTSLQAQMAQLTQRQVVPQTDLDRVMAEAWQVVHDRDMVTLERDAVTRERDAVANERDAVTNERDLLRNMLQQIYSPFLVLQNIFNTLLNGNGSGNGNGRQ